MSFQKFSSAVLAVLMIVQPIFSYADEVGPESATPRLLPVSDPTTEANLQNVMDTRNSVEDIRNTQTVEATNEVPPSEPIVQTPEMARANYIQQIQDHFGSDYNVTFQVPTADPTKINVTVRNKPEVVVADGKVKSLTYTAQSIENNTFTVLANTVNVSVQGVTAAFNGEAIYSGLALLPGNTDPITRLSQISLGYISANRYRFVDAGKFWNINVSFTITGQRGQIRTFRSVTLAEVVIPAHVISYIEDIQTQLGSGYNIVVSPTLNLAYDHVVTITAQGNLPQGRLKSLVYTTRSNLSSIISIGTLRMVAVISGGDGPDITQLSEHIIFTGLKKIPGLNPIVSFFKATFTSVNNATGTYDFMLNGYSWTIRRELPSDLLGLGVVLATITLTYNAPAHVQSYLDEIQSALGNNYRVTVLPTYPDPSTIPAPSVLQPPSAASTLLSLFTPLLAGVALPNSTRIGPSEAPTSFFTVKVEAINNINNGRLRSLTYNVFSRASSSQLIFTNTMQVSYRLSGGDADNSTQISSQLLYDGLFLLPGVSDPLTILDEIVIHSASTSQIEFTRSGTRFRIQMNSATNEITLSRRVFRGGRGGFYWENVTPFA